MPCLVEERIGELFLAGRGKVAHEIGKGGRRREVILVKQEHERYSCIWNRGNSELSIEEKQGRFGASVPLGKG